MSERRRKVRPTTTAPRIVGAPPPRLDRRDDPPVEIFDVVSGPFELHYALASGAPDAFRAGPAPARSRDTTPRGAHRRR